MKRLVHLIQLAMLAVLFIISTDTVLAANVNVRPDGYLSYEGSVVNGDSDKLKKLLSVGNNRKNTLFIKSNGGSVVDAIATSNLITAFEMNVATSKECLSSCTFILFSGRNKYVKRGTRVGVHCPFYTYVSGGTSYIEAGDATYWKLYGMIRAGGMSDIKTHKFLDMTFSHKSKEMRYLTEKELKYFGFNFVESN